MPKNMLSNGADYFWYTRGRYLSCSDCNAESMPCDRELSNVAFEAGARWNMRETTRLSPYVSQFIEMLILLGVFDDAMVSTPSNAAGSDSAQPTTTGDQDGNDDSAMPTMSGEIHVPDAAARNDA